MSEYPGITPSLERDRWLHDAIISIYLVSGIIHMRINRDSRDRTLMVEREGGGGAVYRSFPSIFVLCAGSLNFFVISRPLLPFPALPICTAPALISFLFDGCWNNSIVAVAKNIPTQHITYFQTAQNIKKPDRHHVRLSLR